MRLYDYRNKYREMGDENVDIKGMVFGRNS